MTSRHAEGEMATTTSPAVSCNGLAAPVAAARVALSPTVVAVPAVDRPVAARLEWDFRLLAALRARHGEHLARRRPVAPAVAGAAVTLRTASRPAGRTALGIVGISLLGVIRLIFHREGE